ncbi:MAG: hypothetical protein H6Q58_1774 [Firmicutes bacterium]|nr:hypothetical protein [Bacillota bacterium]
MKISAVSVTLSSRDLLSMVDDFVEVEGLKIDRMDMGDLLTITGSYRKIINIPFEVKIGFGNVINNVVNVRIMNVNILKLNILSSIRNLAMKKFMKDLSEYGVTVDGENVAVDLVMISRLVPYVYFRLDSLKIADKCLVANFEELIYAKNKETVKIEKKADEEPNIKISDRYTATREKMVENVPDKYQKVFEYALMVPDIISLMYRLFKDKRVKLDVKIKVAAILAYLASPVDIMPDFIPMVGKVDDVAIAFFGLNSIINDIPEEIILQNWQGKENIIVTVREAINYISVAVGSENVSKLLHALGKALRRDGMKKAEIEVKVKKAKKDKKKKGEEEEDEEEKVGQ